MRLTIFILLVLLASCKNPQPIDQAIQLQLKEFYELVLEDPQSYYPVKTSRFIGSSPDPYGWTTGRISHSFNATTRGGQLQRFNREFTVMVLRDGDELLIFPDQYD